MNSQKEQNHTLEFFASNGVKFALAEKGNRFPTTKNWPNDPKSKEEAEEHASKGGNVCATLGKHSAGLVALDIDNDAPTKIALIGESADTVKRMRSNAPDRIALFYQVVGELPPKASVGWKPAGEEDLHVELKSTGSAICIHGTSKGGFYSLVDEHFGIKKVTQNELDYIWRLLTGGHLYPRDESKTAKNKQDREFIEKVKKSWTIMEVFKRHNWVKDGINPEGDEIRIKGYGGLLVNEGKGCGVWDHHSASIGGDIIDAWAYCTNRTRADFTDILNEMAEEKGIKRPDRKLNKTAVISELLTGCEIFTGSNGIVYAKFQRDGHEEIANIRSAIFSGYLQSKFYAQTGSTVSESTCKQILNIAAYQASNQVAPIYLRTGGNNSDFYLDLCNSERSVVHVTAKGWEIVSNPPVAFNRTKGMKELPTPIQPNGMKEINAAISEFFNLANIAPEDRILALAWILSAYRPDGPFPVLTCFAEAGSAKTSTAKAFKRLISPYTTDVRSSPKSTDDMYVAAMNDWVIAYDNLSSISAEVSNTLCTIATGGGTGSRQLYEDAEESIKIACTPQIIAGVSSVVNAGDLASRIVSINLPTIPKEKRLTEEQWLSTFNEAQPRILGALLSLSSLVIANTHLASKENLPRMADFAVLGRTLDIIFKIVGSDNSFDSRMTGNQYETDQHAIEASPIWQPLQRFMSHQNTWTGSATDLLRLLVAPCNMTGIPQAREVLQRMPKNEVWTTRRLKEISTNLRSSKTLDISYERNDDKKTITITKMERFTPFVMPRS